MKRKKCKFWIFFASLFLQWLTTPSYAANYVTVASIGNNLPEPDKSIEVEEIVEHVITFWQKELAQVLPDKPDLIVLPEECDQPRLEKEKLTEYYKIRKNQVLDFFASAAKENHCYIVYGTKRQQEDGIWRNSSILIGRDGEIAGVYNKYFPTIYEMEDSIVPGNEAPVFQCDFGKVACTICFDLNFIGLLQKYAKEKPDIVVFSSMYHGGLMQGYWAYQCRSFFVAATAFRNIPSEIRNPLGQVVASNTNYFDYVVETINLDNKMAHLDGNWGKLRKLKEKYGREVTITDPGQIGAVLITSESKKVSAAEMVKEFDIELLDDYFNRSREACLKNRKY